MAVLQAGKGQDTKIQRKSRKCTPIEREGGSFYHVSARK